jgi:hypothetical protein
LLRSSYLCSAYQEATDYLQKKRKERKIRTKKAEER